MTRFEKPSFGWLLSLAGVAFSLAAVWVVDDRLAGLAVTAASAAIAGVGVALANRKLLRTHVLNRRGTAVREWRQSPAGYLLERSWFGLPVATVLLSGGWAEPGCIVLVVAVTCLWFGTARFSSALAAKPALEPRWSDERLEIYVVQWKWGATFVVSAVFVLVGGSLAWSEPPSLNDGLLMSGIATVLASVVTFAWPFLAWQHGASTHLLLRIAGWVSFFGMGATALVHRATADGALTLAVGVVTSAAFVVVAERCRRVAIAERVATLHAEGHAAELQASYPELAAV